ncbi:MAG: VCBS repeat-containing protein [Bacteroidales bacterium]|nr:VCBS repeat-containing protein [Bacteroidales bacterium]
MKKNLSVLLFLILNLTTVAQNEDYSVGCLAGNITVSDLGNTVFSLPINNDILDISLNYSSFNGNGIFGEGFQLSNLSSISRTNKNIFFDKISSAIDYTNGEDYTLDGKHLIKKSAEKYQLENDLTSEITFYNNSDLFLLKKDGKTFYYGNSLESKIKGIDGTAVWNLSQIEDAYKNKISFEYDNLYIKKIKGQNIEIIFEYENRPDIIKQTINAQKFFINHRVKNIIIKYNNEIIKKFEILYINYDSISRIREIKVKNYKGEYLPPIKFQWNFINKNFNILEPEIQNFAFYDNKDVDFYDQYIICGDYDNDCKDDITLFAGENLMFSGNGAVQRLHFSKAHFYKQLENSNTIKYTHQKDIELPLDICLDDIGNQTGGFSFIDFAADGIKELVIPGLNKAFNNQPYFKFFNIKKNIGALIFDNLKVGKQLPVYTFSDFDNSSRILPCYIEKDKKDAYNATLFNFVGTELKRFYFDFQLPSSPEKLFSFDINGNGLNDLIVFYKDGYTIFWNQGGEINDKIFSNKFKTVGNTISDAFITQQLDFDSDGLVDILQIGKESSLIIVAINNGDGTFTKTVVCEINDLKNECDDNKFGCIVYDFDADGKTDIVLTKFINKKTVTFWLKSNGEKLEIYKKAVSDNEKDALTSNFSVGDFNGDGVLELINYGYDCFNGGGETKFRIYQLVENKPSSGKITSISNTYTTTNIFYTFLTDNNTYTKGENQTYPLLDVIAPLSVVSSTEEINGITDNIIKKYKYYNLTANVQGKGLLGFDKIICENQYTGETITTEINSWNTDYYTPEKITQTIKRNALVTTTETEYNIIGLGGKNFFTYPSKVKNTDIYGDEIVTQNTYNTEYGYLESTGNYYPNGFSKLQYYGDYVMAGGMWQPQFSTYIQIIPDDPKGFVTKKHFEYDSNTGSLIRQTDNYGTSKQVATEYKYDEFGNVIHTSVYGEETEKFTTDYTYENQKLITTTKNNPKSIIKYSYDDFGRLISETDMSNPNNPLTTSYGYDNWGNQIKTQYPDGTTSTTEKGWGESNEQFYYELTQQTAAPWQKTWYDILGRKTLTETIAEGGIDIKTYNTYDKFSNIVNTKTLYGDAELNEHYVYDEQNRVKEYTAQNGSITKYTYAQKSVAIETDGKKTSKTFDVFGNITSIDDGVSTIQYTYNAACKPVKISAAGTEYTLEYDEFGNRTSLTDPDGGKSTYKYDCFNNVVKQTDAEGNVAENKYQNGLLTESTCGGIHASYSYDEYGKLLKSQCGEVFTEYTYDNLNRKKTEIYNIDNREYPYSFTYGENGLLVSKSFPDNTTEYYKYDQYGNINEILLDNSTVWKLTDCNLTTRISKINGKYLKTQTSDVYGYPVPTKLSYDGMPLKEMTYGFNIKTGNLVRRSGMFLEPETFDYDHADRLTKISKGQEITEIEYAENGNITFKSGLGNYEYFRKRPHALESVENTDTIIKNPLQEVEYTPFNKFETLTQYFDETRSTSITFTYDADRTRRKSVRNIMGVDITQYYLPDYEELGGYDFYQKTHYINSPDGLVGLYVTDLLGGKKFEAAFTDHLGSITAFYQDTILKFAATYDAFGNRTITTGTTAVTRGYCGVHQHYPSFDIIDMGGRMYDPIVGRFLSPDPYIQDWENSQNFNRYTYCLNNPLKYTDPSGEFWFTPILIGAGIFGIGNLTTHAIRGDINNWGSGLKYFSQGLLAGAAIGALWQFSPMIPWCGQAIQTGLNIYGIGIASTTALSATSGLIQGAFSGNWNALKNSGLTFLGNFNLDENSSYIGAVLKGISRHSWEMLQTGIGHGWNQLRNTFGLVDCIKYYGGATYCIDENNPKMDVGDGMTLGNFIQIRDAGKIVGNFDDYIKTACHGTYLHEYGHTIQGRKFGLSYLFTIGIPSVISAAGNGEHCQKWFERQASRYAKYYFGPNIWTQKIEYYHPTNR